MLWGSKFKGHAKFEAKIDFLRLQVLESIGTVVEIENFMKLSQKETFLDHF